MTAFKPGFVLVLEGTISTGKTSMCNTLKHYAVELWDRPCKVMLETIEPKTLSLYLSDIERYACMFQVIQANKRLQMMKDAVALAERGYVVLVDRGLPGDFAFAEMQRRSGLMTQTEFAVYVDEIRAAFPHFLPETLIRQPASGAATDPPLPVPVRVVYLKCTPEAAMERLRHRNNAEEVNSYTLEYFRKLGSAYDSVIDTLSEIKRPNLSVDIIDWSRKREVSPDGLLSLAECRAIMV